MNEKSIRQGKQTTGILHGPFGLKSTFVFLWIWDKLINLLIVGGLYTQGCPFKGGITIPNTWGWWIHLEIWLVKEFSPGDSFKPGMGWMDLNGIGGDPWRIHVIGIFTYINKCIGTYVYLTFGWYATRIPSPKKNNPHVFWVSKPPIRLFLFLTSQMRFFKDVGTNTGPLVGWRVHRVDRYIGFFGGIFGT